MLNTLVKSVNLSGAAKKWRSIKDVLYKNKVIFVHVPKCGGTSLSHSFRARYPLSSFKVSEEASSEALRGVSAAEAMRFKRDLMAYHASGGSHYIQGHAPIDQKFISRYGEEFHFITLLRDPIDRFISHYHFDPRCRKIPFSAFLESRRGWVESHVLCYFFGEQPWAARDNIEDAAERAIENLEKFSVVGILEDQKAFSRECRDKLNVRIALPKRNIGSERKQKEYDFSDADMRKLKEMCALDQRIYDHFATL
ncbi:sulfotransferase family 2 domain-containing protein [Hyphococcus sp.]|jgi:hypothetical protein|uniref:sulfotransferase family 2 domain-containing protein n=1 Tax=Hyphococcus sp. TaxID=2038636 RepID=UPI003D0A5B11